MTEEPAKAFVIAYDGVSPNGLTIPAEVLRRAERELDAERARRRRVAEEAQAAAQARADAARKPPRWWARLLAAIFFRRRAMNTMHASRNLRPTGLSPALAARYDRIMASAEKRHRIESVRAALATWVDSLEREQKMLRRTSSGADPSPFLTDALCAAADFEMIAEELRR